MKNINFVTLFPEIINDYLKHAMIGRYIKKSEVQINIINIRDFGNGSYRQVDDYCYGTGKSVLLKIDVIMNAVNSIKKPGLKLLMSPGGKKFNNKMARQFSKKDSLTFICGRYEGIDNRLNTYIDDEVSVGDFILNGGELAALTVFECMSRFFPGFTKKENVEKDSFENGLIEASKYTRPFNYYNNKVPAVLKKGNHSDIKSFLKKESLKKTIKKRPEVFKKYKLNKDEIIFLMEHFNEKR
ncbi:MAG: tRNA (guanosine(37)-N1)-methyltransferase TrmD [Candidatus Muiribacteriota bacterium]